MSPRGGRARAGGSASEGPRVASFSSECFFYGRRSPLWLSYTAGAPIGIGSRPGRSSRVECKSPSVFASEVSVGVSFESPGTRRQR